MQTMPRCDFDLPHADERSILERIQAGDSEAADTLYRCFAEQLYRLLQANCPKSLRSRLDTEDLVQSVFRRFFQAADMRIYDCPSADELWKLLAVMALNRLRSELSFQYAAKRDARATIQFNDTAVLEGIQSRDEASVAVLLRLTIQEAIERLPEHFQQVIQLRMKGHEVGAIAQLIRRSKRTIERILQQGYRQLRLTLKECDSYANQHS